MADWQTIHSDDIPGVPPEVKSPVWRRRALLAAGLTMLVVLVLAGLWHQRREGRTALTEDLNAVILAEEATRFRGRPEEALYQADAPLAWRQAYRRSFASPAGQASPGPRPEGRAVASLHSIDHFDGSCALTTLSNAPHDPVRAYCLSEAGWSRAPIPPAAWGDESELEPLPGLRLRFRARDQAFAESLGVELAGLAGWLPPAGLEIVLEPHDLAGPLILTDPGRIVLNSPETVLIPNDVGLPDLWTGLSGPEIVRLALGKALVSRSDRFHPSLTSSLPGADRFIAAAQTVTAMELFLEAEAQARLREGWRAKLSSGWVSPFFAGLLPQAKSASDGLAEVAAFLTADHIYHHYGPERLPSLLAQLPQAGSWDQIFVGLPQLPPPSTTATLKQNYATMRLEIEAAHYAGAGTMAIARLYREYNQPVSRAPLAVKLRYLDNRRQGQPTRFPSPRFSLSPTGILFNWPHRDDQLQGWRLYVSQPGQPEPVLVEAASDLALMTPDGLSLSPGCLGPGADLAIEGEWLEPPRRFQASQITVQRALRLSPRPAGRVTYLVFQGEPEAGTTSQLVALKADGNFRPLLDLNPMVQLFPLPAAEGDPFRLLIQADVPTCPRSWFGLYDPNQGVTNHWFAPAGPVQWIWRPDQAAPLFLKPGETRHSYQVYEATRNYTLEQFDLFDASFGFLGWRLADQQLVMLGFRSYGTLLGLLDPIANRMTWLSTPAVEAVRAQSLSPAGDWLAYPTGLPSLFGLSSQVYLLHLAQPGQPTPFRFGSGQGLASLAWSLDLERPALALLVGPIVAAGAIQPTRLLWVDPSQPEAYIDVAQAGEDEQFANPVFCRNGDLLYVARKAGRYELRRQSPGHPARILLSLERSFYPVACDN